MHEANYLNIIKISGLSDPMVSFEILDTIKIKKSIGKQITASA